MQVLTDVRTLRLAGWRAFGASLIGAGLMTVSARMAFYLPGKPVPITMQVFAVVYCALVLGGAGLFVGVDVARVAVAAILCAGRRGR